MEVCIILINLSNLILQVLQAGLLNFLETLGLSMIVNGNAWPKVTLSNKKYIYIFK
jgi:hypothetical protein